jgi:hypothetical protein
MLLDESNNMCWPWVPLDKRKRAILEMGQSAAVLKLWIRGLADWIFEETQPSGPTQSSRQTGIRLIKERSLFLFVWGNRLGKSPSKEHAFESLLLSFILRHGLCDAFRLDCCRGRTLRVISILNTARDRTFFFLRKITCEKTQIIR